MSLNHLRCLDSYPDFNGFNLTTIELFYLIYFPHLPSLPSQIQSPGNFRSYFLPIDLQCKYKTKREVEILPWKRSLPHFSPLMSLPSEKFWDAGPGDGNSLSLIICIPRDHYLLFIELVNAGVLGKLINSFGVFVPLRRTGMKLTQLKRKTFITATGMRKHKAWRLSLQVLWQPLVTRRSWAGGWWLVASGCEVLLLRNCE